MLLTPNARLKIFMSRTTSIQQKVSLTTFWCDAEMAVIGYREDASHKTSAGYPAAKLDLQKKFHAFDVV